MTREIDGRKWRSFYKSFWEPVPQSSPRARIAHHRGMGFELWVYRYPLGDRRNCVGGFPTFRQAARAVESKP